MSFLLTILLPAVLLPVQPVAPPADGSAPAVAAPAAAPVIDPKAEALLAANEKAMLALKSYSAQCDMLYIYPPSEKRPTEMRRYDMSTLTAVKPNLMRYDGWAMKKDGDAAPVKSKATPTYTFTNDGKRGFKQFGASYREDNHINPQDMGTILEPWTGFYSTVGSKRASFAVTKKEGHLKALRLLAPETVNGVRCNVIAFTYHSNYGEGQDYDGKLFLGPDNLVRREVQTVQIGKDFTYVRDATLSNIRTNFASPAPSTFTYTPPAGVKSEADIDAARPKLLANGTLAPDFTVEDRDGKPVKLSDFRGKTVVLDFWATWCGPCMRAMPHTNDAGKKFKDQNVVVLAVNVWDTKDAYQSWVPKNQTKYDAVTFLLDPHGSDGDVATVSYNVSGIPTQYLIDAQGIIRASFVGNDEDNPKALENAIAAANAPAAK